MRYMNDWDLAMAARRLDPDITPNRAKLVVIVDNLRQWANRNSDGWAYWPKPCNAARRAMGHIESTTNQENDRRAANDITDAEFVASVRPIKSFLTRQGVSHAQVIPA